MTLTGVSAMQSSSTPSTAGTSPWADPQTRYCCRPFMAFRVVIGLTQPAFIPEVKPFKTWVACNPNRASRGDGRCRKTFSPSVTECNPTTATANIRAASVPVPAHPQVSRYEIAAQASGLCPQGYASTELASVEIFVVDQHSRARFIAVNRISIVNIESRRQLIHSGQRLIEIQLTARSHGEQQEWQNNEDRVCCKPIFRAFFWLGVDDLSFMYLPDATLRTQELVAACPPSVFSYADPHCQITPFNWPGEWPCTIQSKAVYNIPYGAQTQK
ncbi:uncharacterized protein L969DRAFT_223270 [Mixia osmundae IAM 14324]|nr:uncharacterized protein L969DRAFT_223270 [Mixia osmundae IAM 14324]KEI37211.1 hypothetical protein L969DRAFT_223270 [Mixia osmundae IAM 14324]